MSEEKALGHESRLVFASDRTVEKRSRSDRRRFLRAIGSVGVVQWTSGCAFIGKSDGIGYGEGGYGESGYGETVSTRTRS